MIFATTCEKDNPSLLAQLREANKYLPWINEAAEKYNLRSCIIAGLGSRESHWGLSLKPEGPDGTGDFVKRKPGRFRPGPLPPDGLGFGRGLLQIDYDWHEFARTGKWMDPRENILYGCKVLADCLKFIELPSRNTGTDAESGHDLSGREILRAVLASYNAGSSMILQAIRKGSDVDTHTNGKNYSADVINRAGWFQLQGWV